MSDGGKGSSPRPFSVSQETYANNFDAIFRKPDPRVIEDQQAEDEAFAAVQRKQREQALDELVRVNQELGLYDETDNPNRNTSNF